MDKNKCIIEKVYNHSIDSYGRQDLTTTGTGEGYFVTDGYAVPINWTKSSVSLTTSFLSMVKVLSKLYP